MALRINTRLCKTNIEIGQWYERLKNKRGKYFTSISNRIEEKLSNRDKYSYKKIFSQIDHLWKYNKIRKESSSKKEKGTKIDNPCTMLSFSRRWLDVWSEERNRKIERNISEIFSLKNFFFLGIFLENSLLPWKIN